MAKRFTTRKIYKYSLHAHAEGKSVPDYRAFFRKLARLDVQRRSIVSGDRVLAMRRLSIDQNWVRITAYEGPQGVAPLIFDLSEDEERIETLGEREVVATRTHVLIDLATRDAAVEYNHRGAKASDVARLLERASRKAGLRQVDIELAPVPSPDFVRAIDDFETIKIASLNIIRPNLNWNKEKEHADALAYESNGQRVEISVHAGRGDSLEQDRGIVRLIKGLGRQPRSTLKNASVSGRRKRELSDTTISLARHLEHQNVRVELGPGGHPRTESVDARLATFLKARRRRRSVRNRA